MGRQPTKTFPDSVTVEQIETEIEDMKAKGNRTEAWMSARARRKMDELYAKDKALRDAFQAGYRSSEDGSFLASFMGAASAFIILSILVWIVRGGWIFG